MNSINLSVYQITLNKHLKKDELENLSNFDGGKDFLKLADTMFNTWHDNLTQRVVKDKENIHTYLNFIQAEMSDEELGLLFYDSISNKGQDKNHKYRFKQNLDDNSFLENISEQTLLSRTHYKLFPKTNFRFLNDDERKLVAK